MKPVGDKLIYEKSGIDKRPAIAISHWNEHFKIYSLKEKMRCASDVSYAELCDRIGKGQLTVEDENFFKSRIIPTDSENSNEHFKKGLVYIIVTTNRYREEINKKKLHELLPHEKTYKCFSDDKVLSHSDARNVTENISQATTGNLPSTLEIKENAPIVITTNHPKRIYKEDGLCNGAKGYICHIQVSEDDEEQVEIIWIILNNKDFGKRYRFEHLKYRQNQSLPEEAIPIFPIKKKYTIKQGNVEYLRNQFSLNLAYAIVVHKTQGHTFEGEAIVDYRDNFLLPGSLYVAITRVKDGNKLFMKDFKQSYVLGSSDVEQHMIRMQEQSPYVFSKTYMDEKIFKIDASDLKISYLNVNSLFDGLHAECVNADHHLQNVDLICLSDTRLQDSTTNEEIERKMFNWSVLYRVDCSDSKKHMGLIFLAPKKKLAKTLKLGFGFDPPVNIKTRGKKETKIQIVHVFYHELKFSFIYCRITPTKYETEEIQTHIDSSDFVLGDLNLDPKIESDMKKLNDLCSKKKVVHLKRITTTQGNQLDHILVDKNRKDIAVTDAFITFGSDHRIILLRLSNYANDEIKEKEEKTQHTTDNCDLNLTEDNSKKDIEKDMKKVVRKLPTAEKNIKHSKKRSKIISIDIEDENEEINTDNSTSEIDPLDRLKTLDGSTWLNDLVINDYGELLIKACPDVFVFSSYFSTSFYNQKKDYSMVNKFSKNNDIFSYRLVIFPLFELSHWFLAVIDNNSREATILDPYTPSKYVQNKHMKRLEKLERDYLETFYQEKYNKKLRPMKKCVKMPPEIPSQKDGSSCGVFMLQFARYVNKINVHKNKLSCALGQSWYYWLTFEQ